MSHPLSYRYRCVIQHAPNLRANVKVSFSEKDDTFTDWNALRILRIERNASRPGCIDRADHNRNGSNQACAAEHQKPRCNSRTVRDYNLAISTA